MLIPKIYVRTLAFQILQALKLEFFGDAFLCV